MEVNLEVPENCRRWSVEGAIDLTWSEAEIYFPFISRLATPEECRKLPLPLARRAELHRKTPDVSAGMLSIILSVLTSTFTGVFFVLNYVT